MNMSAALPVLPKFMEKPALAIMKSHVMVIGIGGVGSWAVEALARSGIGELTLVDMDVVAASNINRQLPAMSTTLGHEKLKLWPSGVVQLIHGLKSI